MLCILAHSGEKIELGQKMFSLENIIPPDHCRNGASTYICTPLHYLERCFGYCVRRYSGNVVFEDYYGDFCQLAANAIEKVRMLRYENYLNERIQKLSERDILTGLYSRKGLDSFVGKADQSRRCFGTMFYFNDTGDPEEESFKKLIVTFAQAVNLSCTGGVTAARTGAGEFLMIGPCDDQEHPEQLLINTLKLNLKMLEKQQDISILKDLRYFSDTAEEGEAPAELLSRMEKRYESLRSAGSEKSTAYLSMIQELHYRICEEPQLAWSAEAEAGKIGISLSYFQHLYRKFISESFNSEVISARIMLAERLLVNTSLNVTEIAERCGYSDPIHFMKLFKRKNGRTALEYRKTAG